MTLKEVREVQYQARKDGIDIKMLVMWPHEFDELKESADSLYLGLVDSGGRYGKIYDIELVPLSGLPCRYLVAMKPKREE